MILGVGVDIVENDRFEQAVGQHGPRFLNRIFSHEELSEPAAENRNTTGWAARFAAKEAVFKAMSFSGFMAWHSIEILNGRNPFPSVVLKGDFKTHADAFAPWKFHLSISHSRDSSVAVAIFENLPEQNCTKFMKSLP